MRITLPRRPQDGAVVVVVVPIEEPPLRGRELERLVEGETEVGEVERIAVGEHVAEVGVEVDDPALTQERHGLAQRRDRIVSSFLIVDDPVEKRVRDELDDEPDLAGGLPACLDIAGDVLAAVPVADVVGKRHRERWRLLESGHDPMVVKQREA